MPQRTPARSSPFHNQQQQHSQQQQHASSSLYHQQQAQQFHFREEQQNNGTASSSSNNNNNESNRIASNHNHQQHQSSMLDLNNVNNNGGDMYLFQSNASVNNTCNSTGSSTTPPTSTSFQFHNMNNSQTFSSNKRRKQAGSSNGGNTSSSASTNNTTTGIENSIFYHMETDFKRKHVDKKRLIWTNELHELFVNAVAQLGLNEARPKEILELMNLPDLTTTHIKSHLQKYRQQVKKGIVPLGINQSNNEMGASSDSETSDNEVLNEDVIVKQEAISSTSSPFKNTNNNQSSHQVYSFNPTTNPNQSSSSNIASSSQNFNTLINDTNSDQVNYIKNILLHFNQASASNGNSEAGPSGTHNSYIPSSSSSSSFQRPTQHVTFANSITNNNITTVNQPHFHLGDGSNILRNCHLLTSANSLSEFLVLLQEVCKAESDMAAIFNGLPVRSTHDLNLIVEGFRIGFICGMKYKP